MREVWRTVDGKTIRDELSDAWAVPLRLLHALMRDKQWAAMCTSGESQSVGGKDWLACLNWLPAADPSRVQSGDSGRYGILLAVICLPGKCAKRVLFS